MLKCRHCGQHKRSLRPRGLCFRCYYTPGLREQYPSTSIYAVHGVGNEPAKKIPTPTTAAPGSAEKLEVLKQRAENGEQLWHEFDTTE